MSASNTEAWPRDDNGMPCPKCETVLEIGFVLLDDKARPCPQCGAMLVLEYDESYDPETEEEDGWFWFEEKKKPT